MIIFNLEVNVVFSLGCNLDLNGFKSVIVGIRYKLGGINIVLVLRIVYGFL